MCKARIESLGLYLPSRRQTTSALVGQMEKQPEFDLEQITGIQERRVRAEDEDSYSLSLRAARDCLSHSAIRAEDLDVIIFTSITRFKDGLTFQFEPAISMHLKSQLGAVKAMSFDISNACAGMCTGVYILDNMIRAGMVKNGMIVSGECLTPGAQTAVREIKDPIDDQFATLTVGDSGAACILDDRGTEEEGIHFIDLMTAADLATLCFGMPSSQNPGIAMYTKTKQMHRASKYLPIALEKLHRRNQRELKPNEFDFIITHQVSLPSIFFYLQVIQEHFQTEMPTALFSVQEFGNTATTTHFVALHRALQEGRVQAGARILFVPMASGMVVGCMSATLGKLEVSDVG